MDDPNLNQNSQAVPAPPPPVITWDNTWSQDQNVFIDNQPWDLWQVQSAQTWTPSLENQNINTEVLQQDTSTSPFVQNTNNWLEEVNQINSNQINNNLQYENIDQNIQQPNPILQPLENWNTNWEENENLDLDYPQNWDSILELKWKVLSVATMNKASDIYVVTWYEVWVKVHWQIFKLSKLWILDENQVNQFLDSIFEEKQKTEFVENLELDFAYSWNDLDWSQKRFRVNAFHQSKTPSATLRYLVNENNTIESLGLPEILKTLAERNSWIVLVCWITWSWKSTTIAAMIDHINANSAKHIISIEDPIEYTFEKKNSWIEQREVWTDTVTFKRAMKSALRQNPNVLFLWEMRDLESISAAITIAESGHLVLSTIHARNSIQCINKIIDGFPGEQQNQIRIQVSEALAAILTQKLIPSKNGKWVELVMEIMINNSAISNLIRESQTHQLESIIQTSAQEWMRLLDSDIIRLVQEDKISTKNAIKYSNDPESMEKTLRNKRMIG